CVVNLSRTPQAVELDLSPYAGRVPIELNGGALFPPIGQLTYLLTMPAYGFYWFQLAASTEAPAWHITAPEPMPEFITIVPSGTLLDALDDGARPTIEQEALPAYLSKRRWFGMKDQKLRKASIDIVTGLPAGREIALAELVTTGQQDESRWML